MKEGCNFTELTILLIFFVGNNATQQKYFKNIIRGIHEKLVINITQIQKLK